MPAAAVTLVGAPGVVRGIALTDVPEIAPRPAAFLALTVNVYAVPLVRPATLIDVHGEVQVPVKLPGLDVAV